MRYYIVDISGRVVNYDIALHSSIAAITNDDVKLIVADSPKDKRENTIRLLSFIPAKYKTSESVFKRLLKVFETFVNYIYVTILVAIKKPSVLHFQWLPFLEFCSIESSILKMIQAFSPKTKLYLTIHNIYPHGFDNAQKEQYKKRFIKISRLFDCFIVHTRETKRNIESLYGLKEETIKVIHHGVFIPDLHGIKRSRVSHDDKLRLISFGHQDPYKGTDLIFDALHLLPDNLHDRIQLAVLGKVQPDFEKELNDKMVGLDIIWKPFFVDDRTLYQDIVDSDVIVLPYKAITQSGVLLLSLYFDKPIICSDLPPFIETLDGYPSQLFFKTGDAESLKDVIIMLLEGKIDMKTATNTISVLRERYSWEEAARLTIKAYIEG